MALINLTGNRKGLIGDRRAELPAISTRMETPVLNNQDDSFPIQTPPEYPAGSETPYPNGEEGGGVWYPWPGYYPSGRYPAWWGGGTGGGVDPGAVPGGTLGGGISTGGGIGPGGGVSGGVSSGGLRAGGTTGQYGPSAPQLAYPRLLVNWNSNFSFTPEQIARLLRAFREINGEFSWNELLQKTGIPSALANALPVIYPVPDDESPCKDQPSTMAGLSTPGQQAAFGIPEGAIIVCVPRIFENTDANQLRGILLHEMMHLLEGTTELDGYLAQYLVGGSEHPDSPFAAWDPSNQRSVLWWCLIKYGAYGKTPNPMRFTNQGIALVGRFCSLDIHTGDVWANNDPSLSGNFSKYMPPSDFWTKLKGSEQNGGDGCIWF